MLKAADAQMAKEIEDMTNGKDYFKKESSFNRITLMYKNFGLEKSFLLLPDPLFKYYISCCLIILILIFLINGLTTNWLYGFRWFTWAIFGVTRGNVCRQCNRMRRGRCSTFNGNCPFELCFFLARDSVLEFSFAT
ncbi:unnamed protein product, partial [Iphiclides podalirius]